MSARHPIATAERTRLDVRKVPQADSELPSEMHDLSARHFAFAPPTHLLRLATLLQDHLQRRSEAFDRYGRWDLPQQPSNQRARRFNETQEAILELLITAASEPKWKIRILEVDPPSPVLWTHVRNGETVAGQLPGQKIRQLFPVQAGIDLFILAGHRRKGGRDKFDMRSHLPGALEMSCVDGSKKGTVRKLQAIAKT